MSSSRNQGVSAFNYRRQLARAESNDRDWNTTSFVYAIGSVIGDNEFGFHRIWGTKTINLTHPNIAVECRPFLLNKLTR